MTAVYRIQLDSTGEHAGLWKFEDDRAIRIDTWGDSANWQARDGLSVLDTMKRDAPVWFEGCAGFFELILRPGQYYPRIARSHTAHPFSAVSAEPLSTLDLKELAVSLGQMQSLTSQLQRICQTVHPADANLNAYGHEIRNLLILACTEVESQWRGVLKANNYKKKNGNLNANDYVNLTSAMRLHEYSINFSEYPWLNSFQPFAGWNNIAKPSRGLQWYDAYNGVKHDRENEFERGTLQNVFSAVSACLVMLCAQYGRSVVLHDRLSEFYVVDDPMWPPADIYYPPYDGAGWQLANYPFSRKASTEHPTGDSDNVSS